MHRAANTNAVHEQDTASDPSDDQVNTAEPQSSSKNTLKKQRRTARSALRDAWITREQTRLRVMGTWTLDGARALEETTKTYNKKRTELANCTADGQLTDDDAKDFPVFSIKDLSAPKVKPSGKQSRPFKQQANGGATPRAPQSKPRSAAPTMTKAEHEDLQTKALNARKLYEDAHAFYKRPPRDGRAKLSTLKAQGEARLERAAKFYKHKRQDLEDAYPNGMPQWLKDELYVK